MSITIKNAYLACVGSLEFSRILLFYCIFPQGCIVLCRRRPVMIFERFPLTLLGIASLTLNIS